jgi:hypothetical protein
MHKQKLRIIPDITQVTKNCRRHSQRTYWPDHQLDVQASTRNRFLLQLSIPTEGPIQPHIQYKKVKVEQSRYRPGVAQRVPGSYGAQISWQWHRMVVRLSALCTGHLYPQKVHPVLISVRGWVHPRAIVRLAGLCHWQITVILSRIEPVTCRFVA